MKQYLIDIIRRRDLISYLVTSGLRAQHKYSFLGYLWWLIDPFLNVAIYYFVVVIVFHRPGGPEYGMYLVTGMIVWRWLSATVIAASNSIISQSVIISQVYLPKSIFPISAAFTHFINFGFGLIVIFLFFIYFHFIPGAEIFWLPLGIAIQLLFMLTICFPIAFACVFVRDVNNIVDHAMRLWFFGSPVIWHSDMISAKHQWLLTINPMHHILGFYRDVLINNTSPDLNVMFIIGAVSLFCILPMIYFYSHKEHLILKSL